MFRLQYLHINIGLHKVPACCGCCQGGNIPRCQHAGSKLFVGVAEELGITRLRQDPVSLFVLPITRLKQVPAFGAVAEELIQPFLVPAGSNFF